MRLSRCQDKTKAFPGLRTRELHTHLYMTKSLPKVFSVMWSAWERISEKLEMAKRLEKKYYKKKND